jgi:hypothetical protein
MGLIKSDRQLVITRRKLAGLKRVLARLRTKHRGAAYRVYASGPQGMIEQLQGEIREYLWLKRARPRDVLRRYDGVRMEDVGPFLARLRIATGRTQQDLARAVGCKQPDIARLEDADYRGHTTRALKAVAEALGVEILIGARRVGGRKEVG